jgi:hypothetical protein
MNNGTALKAIASVTSDIALRRIVRASFPAHDACIPLVKMGRSAYFNDRRAAIACTHWAMRIAAR